MVAGHAGFRAFVRALQASDNGDGRLMNISDCVFGHPQSVAVFEPDEPVYPEVLDLSLPYDRAVVLEMLRGLTVRPEFPLPAVTYAVDKSAGPGVCGHGHGYGHKRV